MKRTLLIGTYIIFCIQVLFAGVEHGGSIRGLIVAASDNEVLAGAIVHIDEPNRYATTNEIGQFSFSDLPDGVYILSVSYLGFEAQTQSISVQNHETAYLKIEMKEKSLTLSDIEITTQRRNPTEGFSQLDIQTRPVQSSQDILRLVPGLFIAQHAGGGKAEQIFLRGFDIDHGTDIALSVDGIPVNLVSHAHGQGYADLHFLIPELAQQVDFQKGMYDARTGNFATAGQVNFLTPDALANHFVGIEAGQFDTYRLSTGINLLGANAATKGTNAYVAAEQIFSNSYFDAPQNFTRRNMFGKFRQTFDNHQVLEVSISDFSSSWTASGQIPMRAVDAGQIGVFGAIDATEGGKTGRSNLNIVHYYSPNSSTWVKNQLYRSKYDFELYSNFTFFLEDSIRGDQIRQKENRTITGYQGSVTHHRYLGKMPFRLEGGIQLRYDEIEGNELSHTFNRRETIDPIALGDINEINAAVYGDLVLDLRPNLSLHVGGRFDQFHYAYVNALEQKFSQKTAQRRQFSPKISLNWVPARQVQVFLRTGSGFHSNDTRVILYSPDQNILPRAWGQDLGVVIRPFSALLFSATAWRLALEQEFVYVGDAGIVEPGGKTLRRGIDLSARVQLAPWLFLDGDYTYTRARAVEDPEGANRIPLAPVHTGTGGFSVQNKILSGSLRTRILGDRSANADHSLVAEGYALLDAQMTYAPLWKNGKQPIQWTISVQNLTNAVWKEAQFETESRLQHELAPVTEIHFTPGTPFNLKAGMRLVF